jgi:hypothetical protein
MNKPVLTLLLILSTAAAPLFAIGDNPKSAAEEGSVKRSPNQKEGQAEDPAKKLGIPSFQAFSYKQSRRDPFLDPSVELTLLGSTKKQEMADDARPMETYVDEIQPLLATQFAVQGIAYDPDAPMALLGGKICQTGAQIVLKLNGDKAAAAQSQTPQGATAGLTRPKSLAERLYATSRFFGLGIENDLKAGHFRLTIKKVQTDRVIFGIPGSARDMVLEYAKDLSEQTTEYASSYAPTSGKERSRAVVKAVSATQKPAGKN